MQLSITNLSAAALVLPYLEKAIPPRATVVLDCAQSDLCKMVDLQEAVADGKASYQVLPTAVEATSGILTASMPTASSSAPGVITAADKRVLQQSYENCKYQLKSAAIAGFNPAATSAADWDGAVAGAAWIADVAAHVRLLNQSTGVIYTLTTATTCTATGERVLYGARLAVTASVGFPEYNQTATTGSGTAVFELASGDVRWFGPPKYEVYPAVCYIPLNSGTLNPASCTYASFDGATAANFAVGSRVLVPTGSNVGVWIVNANKTSLTRDANYTVISGQILRAVYSAGSPQYIQTAATGAATPVYALQAGPFGDWAALNAAFADEATRIGPRPIKLVHSATPYIAEVTGEIPATLSGGAIDLNGAEICGTCLPTSGAPLPAIFHGGPIDAGLYQPCVANAGGSLLSGAQGSFVITVAAVISPTINVGDDIFLSFAFDEGTEVNCLAQWYRVQSIANNAANAAYKDLTLDHALLTNYASTHVRCHVPGPICLKNFRIYSSTKQALLSGTAARMFSLGGTIECTGDNILVSDKYGFGYGCQVGSFDVGGRMNRFDIDVDIHDGLEHQWMFESNWSSEISGRQWFGGSILDMGSLDCKCTIKSLQPPGGAFGYTANAAESDCDGFKFDGVTCTSLNGLYNVTPLNRTGSPVKNTVLKDVKIDGWNVQAFTTAGASVPGIQMINVTLVPATVATAATGLNIDGTGTTCEIKGLNAHAATSGQFAANVALVVTSPAAVTVTGFVVKDMKPYSCTGTLKCSQFDFDWSGSTTTFATGLSGGGSCNIQLAHGVNKGPSSNGFLATCTGVLSLSDYTSIGGGYDIVGAATAVALGPNCTFAAANSGYNWGDTVYRASQNGGVAAISVSTADVTAGLNKSLCGSVEVTGTLTGNRSVLLEVFRGSRWWIKNGTSGAFSLTFKTALSGDTGIVIGQGKSAMVGVNAAGNMIRITADA